MKTIILLTALVCVLATMFIIARLGVKRARPPIFIRHYDRAIFELLPCEDYDDVDMITSRRRPAYLQRLRWVKTSWWRGGRLVPTGEYLEVDNRELQNDFDETHPDYVEPGCKIMQQRGEL